MAKLPKLIDIEPHFTELLVTWEKNKSRRTKAEIFKLWVKQIQPDEPKITEKQFINYTRYVKEREKEKKIEVQNNSIVDKICAKRDASLVEIEQSLRSATHSLVNEANTIMDLNAEDGVPLKERYFALTVVDKIWGKVQKEKEIAIKAHAEKRESVGMFAKLLRGAMSGEFTMKDVETLKQNYGAGTPNQTASGNEGTASGTA